MINGIVTKHLCQLISRQVDDHGLVVWYDPERHYETVARGLNLPGATIACFDGSFFALRRDVDALLSGIEPPRLVVYVPAHPNDACHALAEIEAAGVTLRPGQQPPSRNTRLSIVARNALKPLLGDETAATLEKQVESGKLSLADLDALAEKGEGITTGVVSILFGTGSPQELALQFLASSRLDDELVRKEAVSELVALLHCGFGANLRTPVEPDGLRAEFARYILATDFLVGIGGESPAEFAGIRLPEKPAAKDACVTLAKLWRLRRDLRESYVNHAVRVEAKLRVSELSLDIDRLSGTETFLVAERGLQKLVARALLEGPSEGHVDLARRRQSAFWSEQVPDVQAEWALVAAAGQVLLESDRVRNVVASWHGNAEELLREYAMDERPLSLLDTAYRHMERRYHTFDFGLGSIHNELEHLIARARHQSSRSSASELSWSLRITATCLATSSAVR